MYGQLLEKKSEIMTRMKMIQRFRTPPFLSPADWLPDV